MTWRLLAVIAAVAACAPATKENPCPRALCGETGDGGPPPDAAACVPAWSCTPWLREADGTYARTCIDDDHCGAPPPPEGPLPLPDLDRDDFECAVEPVLDRSCAMLACHGTESGRTLRVYARGRLRLGAGTATVVGPGAAPHTPDEWQYNYDSARFFALGLSSPDDSLLLRKPAYGGMAHAGVHLFASGDADYATIRDWLAGKKLGSACNPHPN